MNLVKYTNTTQSFLVMNIVKTRFYNKMKDNFLIDSLILYTENKISLIFNTTQS